MPLPLESDPQDWESQALFPARLLVGFPPEVQDKLQRAGAALYAMILEGLEQNPQVEGSLVAREFRSLMQELLGLLRTSRTLEGLEEVTESLEAIAQEAAEGLIAAGEEPPVEAEGEKAPLRPFIKTMVGSSGHDCGLDDLVESLAALSREPVPWQWLAAMTMDLVWIKTVLERHIAPRGEVSSLRPGDSALCVLAERIAVRLERPVELLQTAVRTAQSGEENG